MNMTWRRFLLLSAALLALGAGAFYSWRAYLSRSIVRLDTVEPGYYHYEFVELRLRTGDPRLRDAWLASPPQVEVGGGGTVVRTISGMTRGDRKSVV